MTSPAPHHRSALPGVDDGFYWVVWDGDTLVAERLGGEWWIPGFDDEVDDVDVAVISGPIKPPKENG